MPQFPEPSFEVVSAGIAMLLAWLDGKIKPEDKEVIDAHEAVQNGLSDGDFVSKTELATGKNLRDQLTVDQLEQLNAEVGYLKMGNSRN